MFTNSIVVRHEKHAARGTDFDIVIFQVIETEEYQVAIFDGAFDVGDSFAVSKEIAFDRKSNSGIDSIDELIRVAKSDIDQNEFNKY